jgi:phosphoserine phosphatase
VTTTTLSSSQLHSHLFLAQLISQQSLAYFTLEEQQLTVLDAPIESSHKLVLFTEGLQLDHVQLVANALAKQITISGYSVLQSQGVEGFALCAHIELKAADDIKTLLVATAEQLSIELCLIDTVPSLQEPGLLLMDMDSTVIAVECIDEIAELAGVGEQVAAVTAQAMQGKLDFAESLRTRVACLAQADERIIQQVRQALPLMPGIANLVKVLKAHNWKLAIASGGFTYFADYLAERLELDGAFANQLEIVDGKLTGQVKGKIVDAQVKADTLHSLAKQWDIPADQTIAMGDGANDLVMMAAAAFGVAFHAKPVVRQQADVSISKGSMDALIWILQAGEI